MGPETKVLVVWVERFDDIGRPRQPQTLRGTPPSRYAALGRRHQCGCSFVKSARCVLVYIYIEYQSYLAVIMALLMWNDKLTLTCVCVL